MGINVGNSPGRGTRFCGFFFLGAPIEESYCPTVPKAEALEALILARFVSVDQDPHDYPSDLAEGKVGIGTLGMNAAANVLGPILKGEWSWANVARHMLRILFFSYKQ
mmetsp:Transcript_20970/g.30489  ORF Transcript_20970/g.30489 Transcript_20970/m.30489 type:complete len:108 (+) Transcript_20970:1064-1387(+)